MTIEADGKGTRHNRDKPRVDLFPPDVMMELGKVYLAGAENPKVGERNWERGMPYSDMLASAERHILQWKMGVDIDPDDGLPTLSKAIFSLAGLEAYRLRGIGEDDRNKLVKE